MSEYHYDARVERRGRVWEVTVLDVMERSEYSPTLDACEAVARDMVAAYRGLDPADIVIDTLTVELHR
jgi:hypothetical protein